MALEAQLKRLPKVLGQFYQDKPVKTAALTHSKFIPKILQAMGGGKGTGF